MKERINIPLSKMAASDLYEEIVAMQYDTKYPHIHREELERHFFDLARELGFAVWPLDAGPPVNGASLVHNHGAAE